MLFSSKAPIVCTGRNLLSARVRVSHATASGNAWLRHYVQLKFASNCSSFLRLDDFPSRLVVLMMPSLSEYKSSRSIPSVLSHRFHDVQKISNPHIISYERPYIVATRAAG